jgi:hypothetical protein
MFDVCCLNKILLVLQSSDNKDPIFIDIAGKGNTNINVEETDEIWRKIEKNLV